MNKVLLPDLKLGVTFAGFSAVGNVPDSKQTFKRNVSGAESSSAPSLIMIAGSSSGPGDFDARIFLRTFRVSGISTLRNLNDLFSLLILDRYLYPLNCFHVVLVSVVIECDN